MPRPQILFRFHKNFPVCRQNLRLLRVLNPGVAIHGLYGGGGGEQAVQSSLRRLLDTLYALPFEDPQYNWQHGDICIRWWFKERGQALDFTHLAVVEWDFAYVRPITEIFGGFRRKANYVAISGSYHYMLREQWPWIMGRMEPVFQRLVKSLSKSGPLPLEQLKFGIFGGVVLCREFLERFAQDQVRSLCNDEVRLTLYSKLYGIPLVDSGLLNDLRHGFHRDGKPVRDAEIAQVLRRGGAGLHPVRNILPALRRISG
jgi:hypothetical protein